MTEYQKEKLEIMKSLLGPAVIAPHLQGKTDQAARAQITAFLSNASGMADEILSIIGVPK